MSLEDFLKPTKDPMNIPDGSICVSFSLGPPGVDLSKKIEAAVADALESVPATREWQSDHLIMTIAISNNPKEPHA